MIDYHIHLLNGPLTLRWLKQFWDTAQQRGVTEIGISEHCHNFKEFRPMFEPLVSSDDSYDYMKEWISQDFQLELEEYIELALSAREHGIPVKLGLEVDYLPNISQHLPEIIKPYSFDYIIGSVHVIGQWGFDYHVQAWEGKEINQAYNDYYTTLLDATSCGLFDIMAHLDVIKVFGHKGTESMVTPVTQVLQSMAKNDLCLEISSAGLRKPVGEIYPAQTIIEQAASMQIPITFASDAHQPEDVGYEWEQLVNSARVAGYREYRIFSLRKSYAEKIPKLK